MSATYKAIQVTKPGEFETVMKPLVDPDPGQVRIRVEASGVCHSDAGTVEGWFPIIWPRVPGHEVVGRIDALGSGVKGWAVGQRVGIGGLGHLAVQYARHMGFEVAAISRGSNTEALAKKLGAHHYIDSAATDPAAALQALGGAKVIVVTASGGKANAETFKGLRPGGVSIDLGAGPEPIEVTSVDLIFGERKVAGSLTGNPATADTTLRFSALGGVSAMIETAPLEEAPAAYAKMMAGKARFRMVLVTKNGNGQPK